MVINIPAATSDAVTASSKQQHGQRRAEKRCHGKVRPSPRGAKMTQRDDEKHQTHAVARKTEHSGGTHGRHSRYRCAHRQRDQRLVVPATSPLTMAMKDASFSATLRVKLLSSPQPRQAHDGQR